MKRVKRREQGLSESSIDGESDHQPISSRGLEEDTVEYMSPKNIIIDINNQATPNRDYRLQ